jgi:hypothetical protein
MYTVPMHSQTLHKHPLIGRLSVSISVSVSVMLRHMIPAGL